MNYLSRYDLVFKYENSTVTIRFIDKLRQYPTMVYSIKDITPEQNAKLLNSKNLLASILGTPLVNIDNLQDTVTTWASSVLQE